MTDGEIVQLLARVARHEQQAEPLLWMQLKPEVSQTARRMLGGSDADDAVAEILQKILSRAGSYRAEQAGPRTCASHRREPLQRHARQAPQGWRQRRRGALG